MAQGINNLVSAVDTRLVQKDQRNNLQEGLLGELCATLTSLNAKLDKKTQDTQQMHQKFIVTKQRMQEMGNASNDEFGRSIDSSANHFGERLAEGSKVQAVVSSGPSGVAKSEVHSTSMS